MNVTGKIGIVTGDDLIPELPKIEKFGITEFYFGVYGLTFRF